MTKPEPFLGPYGPVKMTPQEIPEGPEYMRARTQAELSKKQTEGYMPEGELAKLRFGLEEQAGAQKEAAGQREKIDLLQQGLAEEARTREYERETAKTKHGYTMEEIAADVAGRGKKPGEIEPLFNKDGSVNVRRFFEVANIAYPEFSFYNLTDPKAIRDARNKILTITLSGFTLTPAQRQLVTSAFNEWFENTYKPTKPKAPPEFTKLNIPGVESWSEKKGGGEPFTVLHPSVLKYEMPTPQEKVERNKKIEKLKGTGKRALEWLKKPLW
jgi:hypothetical protein